MMLVRKCVHIFSARRVLETLYTSGGGVFRLTFRPELLIHLNRVFDEIIRKHGIHVVEFEYVFETVPDAAMAQMITIEQVAEKLLVRKAA